MDSFKKKPLVLLTSSLKTDEEKGPAYYLYESYVKAFAAAGALVLETPNLEKEDAEELAELADGLVITGGSAVNPAIYGEERKSYCGVVREARDKFETELLAAFMTRKKPVFGICHGFQLINAALGGTLCQDIPREMGEEHPDGSVHPVKIEKDSILGRFFAENTMVNSYHHQAVKTLAPCLRETARTENGRIPEGFEHETLPVFGVQWHPERMTGPDRLTKEGPDMAPLFRYFMDML